MLKLLLRSLQRNPVLTGKINVSFSCMPDNSHTGDDGHWIVDRTASLRFWKKPRKVWVMLDLCENELFPTHYTLRNCSGSGSGRYPLRSWKVLAARNASDNNWVEIASEEEDETLPGEQRAVASWPVKQGVSSCYRYFKLIQTGPTARDGAMLGLSGWELYGTLCKREF